MYGACFCRWFAERGKKRSFGVTRLFRTLLRTLFRFSRRKAHIFSLKLTRLLRTPVNTDGGHFSVSRVKNSYTSSILLYGHCLSAHCLLSLCTFETLYPGEIMTNFGGFIEQCRRTATQRINEPKEGYAK